MTDTSVITKPALYSRDNEQDYTIDEATLEAGTETGDESASDPRKATLAEDPSDNGDSFHKNRYDSLKKHHDKTVTGLRDDNEQLKNMVEALTEQLETKAQNAFDFPTKMDKSAILDWTRNNPDAAAIIAGLAEIQNDSRIENLNKQVEDLQSTVSQTTYEKAKSEVRVLVSDFDEVVSSTEFHEWADAQDDDVQRDIYNNPDRPRATARAIKLFKLETGWGAEDKSTQQKEIDASRSVNPTRSREMPKGTGNKKIWKASEIKALTPKQYAENEEAIDQAWAEGRIDQDI